MVRWFQSTVKPVSKTAARRPSPQIMDFVEQMGGYFESNGLTQALRAPCSRWLLVARPERQSSENTRRPLAPAVAGSAPTRAC